MAERNPTPPREKVRYMRSECGQFIATIVNNDVYVETNAEDGMEYLLKIHEAKRQRRLNGIVGLSINDIITGEYNLNKP